MYYLRIYFENSIRELKVKTGKVYSFGSGHKEEILYRDFPKEMSPIKFEVNENSWKVISANKNVKSLYKVVNQELSFNKVYILSDLLELAIAFYKVEDEDVKKYKVNKQELIVGSDRTCDIVIQDKYVSKKQFKLLRYGDQWYYEDLGSANAAYINGKIHTHFMLDPDDELVAGFSKINIKHNILTVTYHGNVIFNLPNLDKEKSVDSLTERYPYYYKPQTRLKEDVPTDEIEVEKVPALGSKPKINFISVLMPPLLMAVIMITVCIMTKGSTTSLMLTIPMLMVGTITSILRYNSEKKAFAAKEKLRVSVCEKHLDEQVGNMERLANQQRKALNLDNPSTKYCMESVEALSTMWDRNMKDKDFMTLRIGHGSTKATFKIIAPRKSLELEEDEYMTQIRQVVEECKYVNNVPITIDLHNHQSVGIIGNKEKRDRLTKNLIYQAAFHHNYDELKIILICDNDEVNDYNFVKWLPHNYDDQKSFRFFANDSASSTSLLEKIAEVIEEREAIKSNNNIKPYYLIVSISKNLTLNHAISRKLTQLKPEINIGTIFNYERLNDLPNDCYFICDMTNSPIMYEKDHASIKNSFIVDIVDNNDYELYARKMAPVLTDTENKGAGFPKTLTFMQGMKAHKFEGLNVKSNWEKPTPERSMAVPIGVTNTGEDFLFDIHEKSMGPHGLVAGMTGSGKSEAVQTFILSMACKFPPNAVSFVIVDFKGTGLILPFKKMPHLAGTISDIDTNISRNLVALMTELERRKALLDKYKVSNISNYLKLYRDGEATEPLSYLFIVIDEFAEFKKKFPDFMKAVSSIFRIGRTLGVHIILLTQKPANVVDDEMNANTRFRWCLKVASSSDSNDMLHHPDAAKITNPGRAYIQVGEDEVYEQVQTYYSGARFSESANENNSMDISIVDLYGKRVVYKEEEKGQSASKESEIDYVIRHLQEFAKENNYEFARKVWSEKLPNLVSLNDVEKCIFDGKTWNKDVNDISFRPVIGLLDDPRQQIQIPLRMDFSDSGSYTLYGAPGTGKTTFLNTLIYSTAVNYTPDEVNIYVMDFGGGSLNTYSKLPHVGGVILPEENEKLIMLQKMLNKELNARKKLFAKEGLTNIAAYKKANKDAKLPYILLVIDNYAYAVQNYPELPDFLLTYIRDGANYGMYFINAVSTVSSMNFRLAENIKNKISLFMSDKGDYSSIFGMSPGITVDNIKGHGICKYGKYCVEYQTALPNEFKDENERVMKIRETIDEIDKNWNGKKARQIPVLPEKVKYSDFETKDILFGMSKEDVEEVKVNPNENPLILISNYRNAVFENVLCKQIIEKYAPKEKLIFGEFKGIDSLNAEDFEERLMVIVKELEERKTAYNGNELDISKYPYMLIYVKNYNDFIASIKPESKEVLYNIIALCKNLNVIVVISDVGNKIKQNSNNEKIIMKMIDKGTMMLLGGNLSDNHAFLKLNGMSYSEMSKDMLLNEGYVVNKNDIGEYEYSHIRICME